MTTARTLSVAFLAGAAVMIVDCAVENRSMSNHDIVANRQWPTGRVVLASVSNVQHGVVLDIGTVADANRVHIAAYDCAGPDRNIVAKDDIADHGGVWIDINAFP